MKRMIVLGLLGTIGLFFVSCSNNQNGETTTSRENSIIEISPTANMSSVAATTTMSYEDYYLELGHYGRHLSVYYQITYWMVDIVGSDAYQGWIENQEPIFDDFHEMAIVQFIKHFDISREQFDEASAKQNEELQGSDLLKEFEYNADVIFTFDNKQISRYYKGEYYDTAPTVPNSTMWNEGQEDIDRGKVLMDYINEHYRYK